MAFGRLKKLAEGIGAQLNPFDNGKTFDTTVNNQQPGYRQQAPQQVQQAIRGAKYGVLANNQGAQNNFLNNTYGKTETFADYAPKSFKQTGTGLGLGGLRSLTGMAQGASGLYDLATPGLGTNRYSKGLDSFAKNTDQTAQNEGAGASYKIGQFGTDALSFLAGGAVAKGVSKAPTVAKFINPINKGAEAISNPLVKPLMKGPAEARIVGKGIQALASPAQQANAIGFTALTTGQDASKGRDISGKGLALNLLQNEGFNAGLPMLGQATKEVAPAVRSGLQFTRQQIAKPAVPEDLLQKQIQLMTQKSKAEIQRPGNVPYFNQQLDNVDQQIKQATTRPILRPFSNDIGAVGKDVNPKMPTQAQGTPVKLSQTKLQKIGQSELSQPNPSLGTGNVSAQGKLVPEKTQANLPLAQQQSTNHPYLKTRGFVDTLLNDKNTAPEIKDSISSLYAVRNTRELQVKAANLVKNHPDIAEQMAKKAQDDTSVAVGAELIKDLQKKGNYEHAITLAESMAKDLTEAGRTVQAASIYGKLTPEGILRFTQKEINKYNELTNSKIKLTPDDAEKLTNLAKQVEGMPEGYDKQVAIAKLVKAVQETMPSTWAEKISTFQTMAQLLNPKTNIRNIGGNTIFSGLENISQTIATPVDKLLSLVTGKRTTSLPNLETQVKSGISGGKQAISEARQGINTGPTSQFELNNVPVFRDKILGNLEKTMNGTLRGADRAAYKAAFDDSINASLKRSKTTTPTPQMVEEAHRLGLYRTFQDSNAISDMFVGMKRTLNKAGIGIDGKRFGLGDLVLKYPKTPANLLARGIDYSPIGFTKAIFSDGLWKSMKGDFDQKKFVDAFSRGVVGSGSAYLVGYALADNGIITAQPEQNKDLRNLQKTEGLGGYQINASAFKRWALSGFNKDAAKLRPGDTLVSYDWAQPIAIPISAGAALGTKKPTKAGAESVNTIAESTNTLAEQPLLQGVQRLFNSNQSLPENILSTLQGAPASFTPTAVSQVNQLVDNNPKNTLSGKPGVQGFVEGSTNQVKAKVPGLAQTLPNQVDVLGQDKQRYQNGTNNPFNVFLNPAFVNKYQPNTTAETGINLYKQTGETKQLPNTVGNTVKVNGQTIKLSGQQQSDLQRYTGTANKKATEILASDPRFQKLPDNQKVNILSAVQTDINSAAKIKLMGENKDKVSEGVQSIIDDNIGRTVELKLASREKANRPKVAKAKKAKVAKAKKGRKGSKGKKGASIKIGDLGKGPRSNKVKIANSKAPSGSLRKPGVMRVGKAKTTRIGGGKIAAKVV